MKCACICLLLSFAACSTPPPQPAVEPTPRPSHEGLVKETVEPYTCGSIERLHTLSGVYLASQPSRADFDQAKDGGLKTVINLRPARENPTFDEEVLVTGLGLTHVNLPFGSPAELDDAIFDQVRQQLQHAERPIFPETVLRARMPSSWLGSARSVAGWGSSQPSEPPDQGLPGGSAWPSWGGSTWPN